VRHLISGKVRELYELDGDRLLLVTSDRISAFDHILTPGIPDKGRILTRLSLWWFRQLADLGPQHLVSGDVPEQYAGRALVCRRLSMLPVECVVRGYLAGSGLADYRATGAICGVPLPAGLVEGSRLPEPIFTPATKAALGEHDENVTFAQVADLVGAADAAELRDRSLAVYRRGEAIARERGMVVADTKLEFGRAPGGGPLVLADEVLTPDSSRFWPAATWEPGRPQPSYDKQYVRDWLTSPASGWSRDSGDPPPPLPPDVVARTRAKYVEAYEKLTGLPFP
jgi:phosphoribosylaminoimidazole-succinocarboxamide synthase